jgi:hypothetical protein
MSDLSINTGNEESAEAYRAAGSGKPNIFLWHNAHTGTLPAPGCEVLVSHNGKYHIAKFDPARHKFYSSDPVPIELDLKDSSVYWSMIK